MNKRTTPLHLLATLGMLLLGICATGGLTGCQSVHAELSTLQDPKYNVGAQSKIAIADANAATTQDLQMRLAGESLQQQMKAMGFNLVTADQADFLASYNITTKKEPINSMTTVSTMSNTVGTIGGATYTGTSFGDMRVPQSKVVDMTELTLSFQMTHDPKLVVWQGKISTEVADAEKYRPEFFHALLERIGQTYNGSARLDDDTAKK